MQIKKQKLIVINAIVAALYVVITSLTFMALEIFNSIAEMLNHLFAFDRKYGIGVAVCRCITVNSVFMSASGNLVGTT